MQPHSHILGTFALSVLQEGDSLRSLYASPPSATLLEYLVCHQSTTGTWSGPKSGRRSPYIVEDCSPRPGLASEMETHTHAKRRSKRDRKPTTQIIDSKKSHLQLQFEKAIESPGGMGKVIKLLNNASDEDIASLNELKWTPLVGIIFRLGKNTTSKGNSSSDGRRLLSLIRLVHQRGLSLNSAAIFAEHLHRKNHYRSGHHGVKSFCLTSYHG